MTRAHRMKKLAGYVSCASKGFYRKGGLYNVRVTNNYRKHKNQLKALRGMR